jgi:hypothetical protein
MSRVTHFEIHATDPDVLAAFYAGVFQWQFHRWEGPMEYWNIVTGSDKEPGINGGLVRRRGPRPEEGQAVNAFVCTVTVASVADSLARAMELGGTTAVPRMAIPGIGWLGYFKDPDGNILGVMQPDPSAR